MGFGMLREQASGLTREPAQCVLRRLAGLGDGRLRLLPARLRHQRLRHGLRHDEDEGRCRHHADPGCEARRRRPLRLLGRQGRPAHAAARLRALLLHGRVQHRLLDLADDAHRPALPVRRRHGRRAGPRRLAGDGEDPRREARLLSGVLQQGYRWATCRPRFFSHADRGGAGCSSARYRRCWRSDPPARRRVRGLAGTEGAARRGRLREVLLQPRLLRASSTSSC